MKKENKEDEQMKIFLTSDIGASKKINGIRIVSELNNTNKFADNLKKAVKGHNLMVFVASSPFYEGTRTYAELTRSSLSLAGICFSKMVILDGSNMEKCKELMERADLVFLAGGDTYVQMKMFENMNLRKHIIRCKGVIVGQSAGALNLAKNVYCSPTPDETAPKKYWTGLGMTDVNIDPHFNPENKEFIEKVLLPDSKTKPFIAITDGSYILDDGEKQTIYGEAYSFSKGEMKQICQNGKNVVIGASKTSSK